MFLAWKEICREKSRFILIIFVIALVSYLAYFLTGLAYGLASSYTLGIEKWSATGVIIQTDANDVIARSRIVETEVDKISADKKASLGIGSTVVLSKDDNQEKIDVSVFGIHKDTFLMPNVIEGVAFDSQNEVVVDDSIKDAGYSIGDVLRLSNVASDYKIVGFTDNARYQTTPIIYMSVSDWRSMIEEMMDGRVTGPYYVNAVIVKNDSGEYDGEYLSKLGLSYKSINDYIYTLPGYGAQVLTFSIMIMFLIIIAAFVLGIFIYILTIQKKGIFGVLKAQGISNLTVAGSVMNQTIILALIGMAAGLTLTLISAWLLDGLVPFMINVYFFLGISLIFILFASFSAIFSVRSVVKIDPARAIA